MKQVYEYIEFRELSIPNRKTRVFDCRNRKSSDLLGYVSWYSNWRQYCFTTVDARSIFSMGCLADIQDFIQQLMEERKNDKRRTEEKV